jgi:hypothetical protein
MNHREQILPTALVRSLTACFLDAWSKAQERIDMPYLTNINLLTDHVRYSQREDRCVSFAATFRILIRLNLKASPFEREHIFTYDVQ